MKFPDLEAVCLACGIGILIGASVLGCSNAPPPPSVVIPKFEKKLDNITVRLIDLNARIDLAREDVEKGACKCKGGCCQKAKASPFALQRLAALLDVDEYFSRIQKVFFCYARPDVDPACDEKAGEEMEDALHMLYHVANKSEILFNVEYSQDVDRYYGVYRALNHVHVSKWHEYRCFVSDLSNAFDCLCRDQIAGLEGGECKGYRMPLAPIPYEERIELSHKEYLRRHVEYWQAHK